MAPLALVKSSRPAAQDVAPYQRPAVRAIDRYAAQLGEGDEAKGRERLLSALMLSSSDDERADHLLQLAEDPDFRDRSIGELAVAAGWRAGALLKLVRDAVLLLAQAGGLRIVSDGLPDVVADVVNRAQRHFVDCEECNATGRVMSKPTKEKPEPEEIDCGICRGVGKLVREADPERQQMVLEMAKLLSKGGGAQIAIQQNVGAGGGERGGSTQMGGLFDRLVAATDAVLERSAPAADEPPLDDAEVVQAEADGVQPPGDVAEGVVLPSAEDADPAAPPEEPPGA